MAELICGCGHKESEHGQVVSECWHEYARDEFCACHYFEPAPEDEQPGYSMAVDNAIDRMKEERHERRD